MTLRGQGSEGVTRASVPAVKQMREHPGAHKIPMTYERRRDTAAGQAEQQGQDETPTQGTTQHEEQEKEKPGGSRRQEEKGTPGSESVFFAPTARQLSLGHYVSIYSLC